MPEKKLAAFVEASGPPSEPAASRTCQPVSINAPLSARATCAEPPRGKKNRAEQTRPTPRPVSRAGSAPFSLTPRSAILLRFAEAADDSCRDGVTTPQKRNELVGFKLASCRSTMTFADESSASSARRLPSIAPRRSTPGNPSTPGSWVREGLGAAADRGDGAGRSRFGDALPD